MLINHALFSDEDDKSTLIADCYHSGRPIYYTFRLSCRYPVIFDDIAARLVPVIPLVVYRLIENDAMDHAERVLVIYKQLLAYHPFRFTFVRDLLAYFYGQLPGKLIVRVLNVLDIPKVRRIVFSFYLFL